MNPLTRRLLAVAAATVLGAPLLAFAPAQADDPVTINLVGINDFHGRIDSATVQWAGTVDTLRAQAPDNSLLISAGDNVSASLFASAVQDDNPTIDVLNSLGLDASATGNHEFDKGYDDLINRIIPRADFPILGANVRKANNDRALDAYKIFDVQGVKVAVIGAVTQETPSLVSPAGIQGLTFGDPVAGINEAVTELDALPADEKPDVMVASFHEGAPDGTMTFPQAMASSAVFQHLVNDTSGEVDAIFMGHTHQKYAYDAPVPGNPGENRPVIQTGNYGENVGQIKLQVDPATGDVTSFTKQNVARVTTADAALITQFPDLAEVKQIRDDAVTYANTVGNVDKGEITADISRAFIDPTLPKSSRIEDRGAESTIGNLVADALLSKVGAEPAGADIGLVNPGGLREDLLYAGVEGSDVNKDGVTTYAELNSILPFANNLNSVSVTGVTLKRILEQQWQRDAAGNVPSRAYLQLGTSKNLTYTYDDTKPEGSRIRSIRINGAEYDPAAHYKVATFSFLAVGGDNFRAFKEGVNTDTGLVDRDGWIEYFQDNSPISPSFAKHAVKVAGVASRYGVGADVSLTLSKLNLTSLNSPANTSVSSKLFYTEGGVDKTRSLGSKGVTGGTSAPIEFTLPTGVGGPMRVESTAYPSGTKNVIPLDVTAATVDAPATTATFGNDVDVPVTVTGPLGTPTGEVVLTNGDATVGTGTLDGSGAATITVDTENLGAGESTLTVTYSGDGSYPASSATTTVTVAKAGTTTSAETPDPVAVSDDVDIETAVDSATGTTPTGTVTIKDGDTDLGSQALSAGRATVTTDVSGLTIGTHTLTVAYAGDGNHEASTSTVEVDVFKGTTELEATAGPATYGTSTVIEVHGDPGASGLVYVGNGDQTVGVGFLRSGVARITLDKTALTPGDHTLDVYFGGSETFDPAQTTVELTVAKATSTLRKTSISPTTVVKNRTKPFVYLSVTAPGFTVDGGTVTLKQSGTSYTGTVVDGKARIRLGVFTSSGAAKTVTATYAGNALAKPTSTSFTVKVVPQ